MQFRKWKFIPEAKFDKVEKCQTCLYKILMDNFLLVLCGRPLMGGWTSNETSLLLPNERLLIKLETKGRDFGSQPQQGFPMQIFID